MIFIFFSITKPPRRKSAFDKTISIISADSWNIIIDILWKLLHSHKIKLLPEMMDGVGSEQERKRYRAI